MRKTVNINKDWEFIYGKDGSKYSVDLPHTWNGVDG